MSHRVPAEVFPPGEFIRDELDARGWSQVDLADILGRPAKAIGEILAGKRAITPETANALGEAFGVDPQFWMNLETAYRLSLARAKKRGAGDGDVARRAQIYGVAPVKDMARRGWIKQSDDVAELEKSVLAFYGVETTSDIDRMPLKAAARKSTSYDSTTPAQRAWLIQARRIASTLRVASFRRDKFDDLIDQLRRLTGSEQEARRVPRVLAEFGIRFLILEHLPLTKIDGAALWLPDREPVIVLSLRLDRIDCFWFTLFHELAHIYYEHNLDHATVDDGIDSDADNSPESSILPDLEQMANDFARDHLIRQEDIDSFVRRVRPFFSRDRINQFANSIKVHPGIIVGQLQRRGEVEYSHHRAMLVKVRDIVTQSATVDGWGFPPPPIGRSPMTP